MLSLLIEFVLMSPMIFKGLHEKSLQNDKSVLWYNLIEFEHLDWVKFSFSMKMMLDHYTNSILNVKTFVLLTLKIQEIHLFSERG